MTENTERLFVITGGPSSGKSTLVGALGDAGYGRSVEAGRGVIRDQMTIAGRALPWVDSLAFAELMLSWEMRSYHLAQDHRGAVFFDRGVPDVVGYLRLLGLPMPEHIDRAAAIFRYNRRVFIAPPWQEIFANDHERKQSWDEAVRTYEAMFATYTAYGYEFVEIPRVSVSERVRFILQNAGIDG
jgi:predicted ATPase